MRKFFILTAMLFLFFACGNESGTKKRLKVVSGKEFQRLEFKKVFETTLRYCKWCLPALEGVLCLQSLDSQNKKFRFSLFDFSGNIIKQKDFLTGQGPDEMLASIFSCAWVSSYMKGIIVIDVGGYVKFIEPENFSIKTMAKPSLESFSFCRSARINNVEEKDNRMILALASAGFYEDNVYYIVEYKGSFKDFRVIEKLQKRNPHLLKSKQRGVSYTDYYWRLRESLPYTVDWKREDIYLVPDTAEEPVIEKINIKNGRIERYWIEIDFKSFEIDKERIEHFCKWFNEELPEFIRKSLKNICYIPPYPPPIQGIKIIENWLLIITGKRKWDEGKNWVLVYHLPELRYEGSFYIPFPDYGLETKWVGKYYITRETLEGGELKHSIYEVKGR